MHTNIFKCSLTRQSLIETCTVRMFCCDDFLSCVHWIYFVFHCLTLCLHCFPMRFNGFHGFRFFHSASWGFPRSYIVLTCLSRAFPIPVRAVFVSAHDGCHRVTESGNHASVFLSFQKLADMGGFSRPKKGLIGNSLFK